MSDRSDISSEIEQGAALRIGQQWGNRGEDAKEYYFYLDSTPTHSYMKNIRRRPIPIRDSKVTRTRLFMVLEIRRYCARWSMIRLDRFLR
jgi:hypothetical protein